MRTSTLATLTALLVFMVGIFCAVGLWTTSGLAPPTRRLSALAVGALMTALAGRVLVVGLASDTLLLSKDRLGRDTRSDGGINTDDGGRELFDVRFHIRPDAPPLSRPRD